MTHTNKPASESATTPDGNMSNPATMPALGMTQKDLPDRLRPEVVDIEILENLADMPSAAASDGTGTSGNIKPDQQQQASQPPQPAAPALAPPQQL